jgi:hypothetical protein
LFNNIVKPNLFQVKSCVLHERAGRVWVPIPSFEAADPEVGSAYFSKLITEASTDFPDGIYELRDGKFVWYEALQEPSRSITSCLDALPENRGLVAAGARSESSSPRRAPEWRRLMGNVSLN